MRRQSRQVSVGDVKIGGGAPITVQSMLSTHTRDVEACLKQIDELKAVGCDLIRVAVPDEASAEAFKEIVRRSKLPLIADVHYSYKLAMLALDSGAKKLRINPGNMTDFGQIQTLSKKLVDLGVPVRVGVNGGSLAKKYKNMPEDRALVESALECAEVFEKHGMSDIVIAIKASDPMLNIEANRLLAKSCDYPLHIGVTEAGTLRSGLVKSAIGIGTLLMEGIGDTVRVSLSADVKEEALAARRILKTLGIQNDWPEVVSCPTCSRTEIDVEGLANRVEMMCAGIRRPLKISVLGCPLNGIGEGEHSDIGVAGGKEKSVLMLDGKIYKEVNSCDLDAELQALIKQKIQ